MLPTESLPQTPPVGEVDDEGDFQSGVVPEQELDGSIPAKDNNDAPAEVYQDLPHLEGPNEWTRAQSPTEVPDNSTPVQARRSARGQVPSDQQLRNVAHDKVGAARVSLINELSSQSVSAQANR